MQKPNAIRHRSCGIPRWIIGITCRTAYTSTNENIKVFIPWPLPLIYIIVGDDFIHLATAIITLVTQEREGTRNTIKARSIRCFGGQHEFYLYISGHALKILLNS